MINGHNASSKPFDDGYLTRQGFCQVARHAFTDATGAVKFEKLRYQRPDRNAAKGYQKTLTYRHPNRGGWFFGAGGDGQRPLYRLQNIVTSAASEPVYVTEGERNADDLAALNLLATTIAASWSNTDIEPLRGRDIYVLADADAAGEEKALAAAAALYPIARSVRIVRLPSLEEGADVSDWLRGGYTVTDLAEQCRAAPFYQPELDEQKGPPPEPLVYVDIEKWIDAPVPPRQWVVLNRIPAQNVTLLTGTGGIGKSIIAMQLTVAVVVGRDWLGTMPEPGPVMYLSAEDDEDEMHRRFAAIARHYDISFRQLLDGGLHLIDKAGKHAALVCPGRHGILQGTPLLDQIHDDARRIKPRLIILDSRNQIFAGNINDPVQANDLITGLRGLARGAGTSILLISHPSVAGMNTGSGLSGSMGWHDSVRARMYFEKVRADNDSEPDKDLRTLTCMKNNYGPDNEVVTVRWRNGVFIPEAATGSLEKVAQDQKADDIFLRVLGRFEKQNMTVSPHATSNNFAPRAFAEEDEAKGVSKPALRTAMRRLIANGKVRVTSYGPPSKTRQKLELAIRDSGEAK
jgi:RecA-family ATPase